MVDAGAEELVPAVDEAALGGAPAGFGTSTAGEPADFGAVLIDPAASASGDAEIFRGSSSAAGCEPSEVVSPWAVQRHCAMCDLLQFGAGSVAKPVGV